MEGRNPYYRNRSGYYDKTAGDALANVSREQNAERRKGMAKRSCRRTQDEKRIHEKAVKMRKMTDEQLVYYVEDRVEKARSEGYNKGKAAIQPMKKIDVKGIIQEISSIKGIGTAKLQGIEAVLVRYLEA